MEPIFDLRFVIGCFFSVVGLILLAAGTTATGTLGSGIPSSTIDFVSGGLMAGFGLGMFALSFVYRKR